MMFSCSFASRPQVRNFNHLVECRPDWSTNSPLPACAADCFRLLPANTAVDDALRSAHVRNMSVPKQKGVLLILLTFRAAAVG